MALFSTSTAGRQSRLAGLQAQNIIQGTTDAGSAALANYSAFANDALTTNRDAAIGTVRDNAPISLGYLDAGYGQARGDVLGSAAAARSAFGSGLQGAESAINTGADQAYGYIFGGRDQGLGAIDQGYADANRAYDTGKSEGLGAIDAGAAAARVPLNAAIAGFDPYVRAGNLATGAYSDTLGLNGVEGNERATSNFRATPGYQYQVDQASDAAARKAAALGISASGNTLEQIARLGSSLADQEYGTYQDRLSGLSAQGLAATGAQAQQRDLLSSLEQQTGLSRADLINSIEQARANTATTVGGQRADLYFGAGNSAAGVAQNTGSALAGLRSSNASDLANLELGLGSSLGNLDTGLATAQAGVQDNLASRIAQLYGSTGANQASSATAIGSALASLFARSGEDRAQALAAGEKGAQEAAANNDRLTLGLIGLPFSAASSYFGGRGR